MRLLVILFLITVSNSLTGQDSLDKMMETFFGQYEMTPVAAVDSLFHSNPYLREKNPDGVNQVLDRLSTSLTLVGDYRGYELIATKTVGSRMELRSYLVYYDRQPIRFLIAFYRVDDRWRLYSFEFNDTIKDELIEAATYYRLPDNY